MGKNKKKEENPWEGVTDKYFGFDESSTYIQTTGTTSCTLTTTDCSTTSIPCTTLWSGSSMGTFTYNDPYAELEEFKQEKEDEEKLRKENPSLQEAYEQYQLIKKLVQDEECDKYFDDKMKVFKK